MNDHAEAWKAEDFSPFVLAVGGVEVLLALHVLMMMLGALVQSQAAVVCSVSSLRDVVSNAPVKYH